MIVLFVFTGAVLLMGLLLAPLVWSGFLGSDGEPVMAVLLVGACAVPSFLVFALEDRSRVAWLVLLVLGAGSALLLVGSVAVFAPVVFVALLVSPATRGYVAAEHEDVGGADSPAGRPPPVEAAKARVWSVPTPPLARRALIGLLVLAGGCLLWPVSTSRLVHPDEDRVSGKAQHWCSIAAVAVFDDAEVDEESGETLSPTCAARAQVPAKLGAVALALAGVAGLVLFVYLAAPRKTVTTP